MVCATATSNMNHPNAYIGLRLPNAQEYWDVSKELLIEFWRGTGDFADLDSQVGARVFSARLTAALQEVTDRGDREALVVTYQKSLNIYVQRSDVGKRRQR